MHLDLPNPSSYTFTRTKRIINSPQTASYKTLVCISFSHMNSWTVIYLNIPEEAQNYKVNAYCFSTRKRAIDKVKVLAWKYAKDNEEYLDRKRLDKQLKKLKKVDIEAGKGIKIQLEPGKGIADIIIRREDENSKSSSLWIYVVEESKLDESSEGLDEDEQIFETKQDVIDYLKDYIAGHLNYYSSKSYSKKQLRDYETDLDKQLALWGESVDKADVKFNLKVPSGGRYDYNIRVYRKKI